MMRRLSVFSLVLIVSLAFPVLMAQNAASYEVASDWVELREGMEWGPVSSVSLDRQGRILAMQRVDPAIVVLDATGKFITQEDILLVADANGGSITIVDAGTGQKLDVIDGLGRPHWVSMDTRGNIYFADVRAQNLGKLVPKK